MDGTNRRRERDARANPADAAAWEAWRQAELRGADRPGALAELLAHLGRRLVLVRERRRRFLAATSAARLSVRRTRRLQELLALATSIQAILTRRAMAATRSFRPLTLPARGPAWEAFDLAATLRASRHSLRGERDPAPAQRPGLDVFDAFPPWVSLRRRGPHRGSLAVPSDEDGPWRLTCQGCPDFLVTWDLMGQQESVVFVEEVHDAWRVHAMPERGSAYASTRALLAAQAVRRTQELEGHALRIVEVEDPVDLALRIRCSCGAVSQPLRIAEATRTTTDDLARWAAGHHIYASQHEELQRPPEGRPGG